MISPSTDPSIHSSIYPSNNPPTDQFLKKIARHIWQRKALWLICKHPLDIPRVHIADLRGKYHFHGLDIVEMRALHHVLPTWEGSSNGSDNHKAEWRRGLKARLDELVAKEIVGELTSEEARNAAYADYDAEAMVIFDPDKPLHRQFGVSASAATLLPGQRRAKVYSTPSSSGRGGVEGVDGPCDISSLSAHIGITLPSTGGDSPCSSPTNIYPAAGTRASNGPLSNNNNNSGSSSSNNSNNNSSGSGNRGHNLDGSNSGGSSSGGSSSGGGGSNGSRRPPLPKGNNMAPHSHSHLPSNSRARINR